MEFFRGFVGLDRDGNIIEVDVFPTLPYSYTPSPSYMSSLELPGDYILEFLDYDANMMRSVPFGFAEVYAEGINPDFEGERSPVSSSENWWVPVEDPPDYASYRILRNGVEIIEVARSANAPVVTITEPVAGQVLDVDDSDTAIFAWDGFDADGDDLIYDVRYSIDGGETTSSFLGSTLNHDSIVKEIKYLVSSETARFKVMALDGTRSAIAESSLFTVVSPPDPPRVTIASPDDGTEDYNPWWLSAHASEEVGIDLVPMDDSDIEWSSNIDGDLQPDWSGVWLSPGTHQLTVTATDRAGRIGSATVTITVLEWPEPEDKDSDR